MHTPMGNFTDWNIYYQHHCFSSRVLRSSKKRPGHYRRLVTGKKEWQNQAVLDPSLQPEWSLRFNNTERLLQYALPCCVYMTNIYLPVQRFGIASDGRLQSPLPLVIDYPTILVYIIFDHILTSNFPVIFHALPTIGPRLQVMAGFTRINSYISK